MVAQVYQPGDGSAWFFFSFTHWLGLTLKTSWLVVSTKTFFLRLRERSLLGLNYSTAVNLHTEKMFNSEQQTHLTSAVAWCQGTDEVRVRGQCLLVQKKIAPSLTHERVQSFTFPASIPGRLKILHLDFFFYITILKRETLLNLRWLQFNSCS